MVTVAIKEQYAEALSALGDVQVAIDLALQRYTIEQITAKIAQLRQRDSLYQREYGMGYSTFASRVAQDEAFVGQLEAHGKRTWERDLSDWEFSCEGIEDWTRKLQSILLGS